MNTVKETFKASLAIAAMTAAVCMFCVLAGCQFGKATTSEKRNDAGQVTESTHVAEYIDVLTGKADQAPGIELGNSGITINGSGMSALMSVKNRAAGAAISAWILTAVLAFLKMASVKPFFFWARFIPWIAPVSTGILGAVLWGAAVIPVWMVGVMALGVIAAVAANWKSLRSKLNLNSEATQ